MRLFLIKMYVIHGILCIHHGWVADFGVLGVVSLEETGKEEVIPTLAAVGGGSFSQVVVCCSNVLKHAMQYIVEVGRVVSPYTGHLTVISNVSESAHHEACPGECAEHCYGDMEREILVNVIETCQNSGQSIRDDLIVRVKFVDIPCMMVGSHAFVFSRDGAASFLVDDDVHVKVTVNAHHLASVSRILDVQPEAFCVGPLAESVGRAMSFIPAHDSSHGRRAAFVIVDRSLDTATASEHSEYFIHRMLSQSKSSCVRPSVFHPSDPSSRSYIDFLMSKTHKEALLFIRKWLKEAIRESKLKFSGRMRPGAVSAEDLQALCAVLYQDSDASMRHASILQIAEIACACLSDTGDAESKWDELHKAEQVAKLSAEDGPGGLVALIRDELMAAGRGAPPPHGIFPSMQHLIMGCYWIKTNPSHYDGQQSDVLSGAQQRVLGETLAESSAACILRWKQTSGNASKTIRKELPWLSDEFIKQIMESAEDEGALQTLLQPVSQKVIGTICSLPAQYDLNAQERGPREDTLILRLLGDVLSGRHVPSMKHIGTSIAGLLKSGLGRIGLQHHHPGEYETVVLFVLGGITPHEISHVRSYCDHIVAEYHAQEKRMPHIVLGGSSLLAPSTTLTSMFT